MNNYSYSNLIIIVVLCLGAIRMLMNKTDITAKDGNTYFYTTSLFNAENPLGVIKATLKEYSLYKIDDAENLICKLYKTNDGNWYDLPMNNSINPHLATFIKMAIDESEKTKTTY